MPTPSSSAKLNSDSAFTCAGKEWVLSACKGEPFYEEFEGKRYCVFHFPSEKKRAAFKEALTRKINAEDYDFKGVWFPDELQFTDFTFNGAADFSYATFNAPAYFYATFGAGAYFVKAKFSAEADFTSATFKAGAYFNTATFNAVAGFSSAVFSAQADFNGAAFNATVDFSSAVFDDTADFSSASFQAVTYFNNVTFNKVAYFNSAIFTAPVHFRSASFCGVADFSYATFNAAAHFYAAFNAEAGFRNATFKDYLRFAASEGRKGLSDLSLFDFQYARTEKPDQVSFHTLTLSPQSFVNLDARKFNFTNVEWRGRLKHRCIRQEIADLEKRKVSSPHRLLSIACRQLAVNAEENHRYEEASELRYWSMDVRRRENWHGFAVWRLSWWYWVASGYGERVFRAFLVLLGMCLLFAWLYTQKPVGFAHQPGVGATSAAGNEEAAVPLHFRDAVTYSASVMTLQRPDRRQITRLARNLVFLETVLGPLQAALLALAIRRKFMR